MSANDWTFTEDDLRAAANHLSQQISISSLLKDVQSCTHTKFSHRTFCPFHKDGAERTPSFYFSEDRKDFICFSCRVHGNSFDLLARLKGRPWQWIIRDFLKKNPDFDLSLVPKEAPIDRDLPHRIDLELAKQIRELVDMARGTDEFDRVCHWADRLFYQIDERLSVLQATQAMQTEQFLSFKMYISLEIQRFRNAYRNHW